MARRRAHTPVGRLRRDGVRASSGPWILCAARAPHGEGRLIVALGRTAGRAATRSRIRRIARDVFAPGRGRPRGADLLLLARADITRHPRRQVRAILAQLLTRVAGALSRRQASGASRG